MAAVAGAALLLVGGLAIGSPAVRRRLIACLALVAAIYGLIAIARSLFAGSVGLVTLASTLRFHYAAGALLAAAIAVALGAVAARWPAAARAGRPAFAAAALVVIWMALIGPRPPLDTHETRPPGDGAGAGRDPRRHLGGAAGRLGGDSQPAVQLGRVAQLSTPAIASPGRRGCS